MRLKYKANRLIQENSQFTVGGPLIWYDDPQVRLWMILNINYNDSHHMGMSQMWTGVFDYFRPSKPHSGKLWLVFVINEISTHQFVALHCTLFTFESSDVLHLKNSVFANPQHHHCIHINISCNYSEFGTGMCHRRGSNQSP